MILILLVAIIWASAFVSIKILLDDMGPVWAAASRVFVGFIVLLPLSVLSFRKQQLNELPMRLISVIAALNMVVPFMLISWSLTHIEAGISALLLGTTPLMAMLIGHFVTGDERINIYSILAVIVGMTGIMLVVGADIWQGVSIISILAQLGVITAGFCYVSAGFIMRQINLEPLAFTVLALGTGSALLLSLAFIIEGVPPIKLGSDTWVALIWLGTFPTGLAYLLRFYLVKRVGVSIFAVGMNTIPVFGIVLGAIILGETIETTTLIALFLVLCGLYLARQGATGKV